MTVKQHPILVLGPGSWGSALALLMARHGCAVNLWGNDSAQMKAIATTRENPAFLAGHHFPENIAVFEDLAEALVDVRDILLVVPSSVFTKVLNTLKPMLASNARIAWATKGIDLATNHLMSQRVAEVFGDDQPMMSLSGPSFAKEVANNIPTIVNIAGNNADFLADMQQRLTSDCFRVHVSDDIVGVQLCGVVKNVLAIAAGMVDGFGWGINARAALISCGLLEMSKLIVALGGREQTVMDVAGMGDLILTCSDNQSRNRRLGLALGEGKTKEQALAAIGHVVEGVDNARQVEQMATQHQLSLPIIAMVNNVLNNGANIKESLEKLFAKQL